MQKARAVFGPVSSRRLGRSLGIDLLPFKTCSHDCVYCECGKTTALTVERKEYYPTAAVLKELDDFFAKNIPFDYATFSGVGEPTLHSGLGTIIRHIRQVRPETKICLLTNASLLGDLQVQRELESADVVVPSLDGSNEEEFSRINRPVSSVTLAGTVAGLCSFRTHCKAAMWMEIFIVPGINDSPDSVKRFRRLLEQIGPDKVQLNSLDRPGTESNLAVPSREEMEQLASAMTMPEIPVEIISRAPRRVHALKNGVISVEQYNQKIIGTLKLKPATPEEIASASGFDKEQIRAHLHRLEQEGIVSRVSDSAELYRLSCS